MGNQVSSSSSSSSSSSTSFSVGSSGLTRAFCNIINKKKLGQYKVIIHGMNSAGKTTILYRLATPQNIPIVATIPTIGFNVETISLHGSYEFTAWDIGGRDKIRPLIRHYFTGTQALIYVIDSSDHEGFEQAKDELFRVLSEPNFPKHRPVLVFCNKQDLPDAMSPSEICAKLGIFKHGSCHQNRSISVVGCEATTGKGLEEGMFFLARAIEGAEMRQQEDIADSNQNDKAGNHDDAASTIRPQQKKKDDLTPPAAKLGFNPVQGNSTLENFSVIKNKTQCPFAKAAKIWGGTAGNSSSTMSTATIEDDAKANVNALTEFCIRSNRGEKLDGYCIELNDGLAVNGGPSELGQCVKRMLTALADLDPLWLESKSYNRSDAEEKKDDTSNRYHYTNTMRVNYIGSNGWRFRFYNADFFVTTFAPCYPTTSSRYGFGVKKAFILLQPELSFLRHNLPDDTPRTNWGGVEETRSGNVIVKEDREESITPQTVMTIRDKTRVAYKKAGRQYHIPKSTPRYPMAEHIVKPIHDNGTDIIRWWM